MGGLFGGGALGGAAGASLGGAAAGALNPMSNQAIYGSNVLA